MYLISNTQFCRYKVILMFLLFKLYNIYIVSGIILAIYAIQKELVTYIPP